jgi:hypothetical protein
MKKTIWFWVAAILLMFVSVVFQRQTGPTYPLKANFEVDTLSVMLKLPRSYEVDKDLQIEIPALSWEWSARLYYRPYPTDVTYLEVPFWPEGEVFVTQIPAVEHKAAKLEYFIKIENFTTNEVITLPADDPIIIRYKGAVPAWALLPHILLMFLAMIFSNLAGFMALFNDERYKFWGLITIALIFVGGLVFGPIVQKFAFGHYWTGFPFGSDLTDNKTLIMFVVWGVAILANLKKSMPWLVVIASLVTIIVYCIPHSMRGSEFNYETGEVVTGMVNYFSGFLP